MRTRWPTTPTSKPYATPLMTKEQYDRLVALRAKDEGISVEEVRAKVPFNERIRHGN